MKVVFFLLASVLLVSAAPVKPVEKDQTIYFFGAWFNPGTDCTQQLDHKYGFKRAGAGCIPTQGTERQNKKAFRKLQQRNGPGWVKKYNEELEKSGCFQRELLLD